MKMNTIKKRIITGIVSSAMIVGCLGTLTGCGETDKTGRNMNIELIDPVGTAESCVAVQYRNIYNSESYSAMVCPKVTEYSYDSSVKFAAYGKMPGEQVSNGDGLILSDTTAIDKSISGLEDSIKAMEETYADTMEELNKSLSDAETNYNYSNGILENWVNTKKGAGDFQSDTEYQTYLSEWQKTYDEWNTKNGKNYIALEKVKQTIKETGELYELDHSYQVTSLNNLKADRNNVTLKSKQNGYVVAVNYYEPGEYISGGVPATVVGDLDTKEIRCEFINKGVINKAESVYAMVNGEKYEVEYEAIDTDEYDRLKELNGNVYSTFHAVDPEGKIQIGDYAVIVIVKEIRENVLCVPKSAISSDETGYYVYLNNGTSYEPVYIKTGVSDGLYTEVLSGLSEGDMIKSSLLITGGSNEAKIVYGSVSAEFSENGYLYYTEEQNVLNKVEYGVVYLDEICVSQYEQVTKGQEIAKIHVVSDTIEIARQERILLRKNENLQKLIDEDAARSADDKQNTKAIERAQKEIQELQDKINKMKADGNTKSIVSPIDGIITDIISAKVGDLLNYDKKIAMVADQSKVFIAVDDQNHRLTYGNNVKVSYRDNDGNSCVADGMVVTVNNMVLSSRIQNDYVLVQIPAADIAKMAGSNRNSDGWWSRQTYNVTATVRSAQNVLVIPRRAVTEGDNATFVTVKDENGTIKRVSFVAGGSDSTNYWVAEGLTEGMTVCWE